MWEQKFKDFEVESEQKMENLKGKTEIEMEELNKRLDQANAHIKIKPVPRLKELQCQEKLVALNERIEEA